MKHHIATIFAIAFISGIVFAAGQNVRQATQPQNTQQTSVPKGSIEGLVTRAGTGQPLKGTRISIRRAQNPAAARGVNAQQNPRAAVIANLAGTVASLNTDSNGRFVFTGVEPGQYRISAERDGYVPTEYGQRTTTGAGIAVSVTSGQRLNIELQLNPASVLSGRVRNEDGEPSSQATVQAYTYQYADGNRTLAEVASDQTNDLGEYRLFWLQPGEYFISVTPRDPPGEEAAGQLDVSQNRGEGQRGARGIEARGIELIAALGGRGALQPFVEALIPDAAPVYYPGTIDPDAAVPVAVAAGSEIRGVDFNLRPVRTATVSGRVVAPFSLESPGQNRNVPQGQRGGGVRDAVIQIATGQNAQVSLSRVGAARSGLALARLGLGATPVGADGTFEIRSVAPGSYNLTATARDQSGQQFTAKTRLEVGNSDVGNVVVSVRPGVEIRGRITLESAAPPQFKMSQLRVGLVAEDSPLLGLGLNIDLGGRGLRANLPGVQPIVGQVAEDGTFTLPNVAAMDYRVRVTGLPAGAYVESGRIGSADALAAPIAVDDLQTPLQLSIGFSAGRVSGTVVDATRNPFQSALAVLVPDEPRRGRSELYFSATSDSNGQFNFNSVPPGKYKVFAWENVPSGAYQYPDFIRRFEERGQLINVDRNGVVNAEIKLIPAQNN